MQLCIQDCRRGQLRVWGELLATAVSLTDADRQAMPLPSALTWLHYFVRPMRLLRAYGPEILRQAFRTPLPAALDRGSSSATPIHTQADMP
jgi:hypothetical protein